MIHISYVILIGLGCLVLGAFVGALMVERWWLSNVQIHVRGSSDPSMDGWYVKTTIPTGQEYMGEIKKV